MNKRTNIMKQILIVSLTLLVVLPGIATELFAQATPRPKPLPDPQVVNPPDDLIFESIVRNRFRVAGVETGVSTYGAAVGLPVFLVHDQLKLVPMAGRFWNTLPEWTERGALGGKVLHYMNRQQTLSRGDLNPYAGVVGLVGDRREHHFAIAVGIEPFFSRYLKLGFEVQSGLRYAGDTDRVFLGAAFTMGIGW